MNGRDTELIAQLQLQPHPEGGWYREVFRSPQQVQPADDRPPARGLRYLRRALALPPGAVVSLR